MDAVSTVTVNGREYKVMMFDPMTAFDFFCELQNLRENKLPHTHLGKKALGRCRTDMARELSDEVVFTEHFSKYPEDMFELMAKAVDALCRPFVKSRQGISKTAKS